MPGQRTIRIISWAMYDLANQFFGLNIIALYFVRWITVEQNVSELAYATVYALSTLAVALLMPWWGALADARRSYRLFLALSTGAAVLATLFLAATRAPGAALMWFALANIGCQAAVVFYNALLPSVAPAGKIGLLSGVGKLAGYLGAILCLLLSRAVFAQGGYHAVFQMTGWLFLLFSLPCLIFVPDPPGPTPLPAWRSLWARYSFTRQLRQTARRIINLGEFRGIHVLLQAVFFGLAAVQVIMLFMTVYVSRVFEVPVERLNMLLVVGTVSAMVGSMAAGLLGDKWGHKRTLRVVFGVWVISLLITATANSSGQWVIAVLGGMNLGATWVSVRAFALSLMPRDRVGELYGIFNLVGFAAGIFGPVYWGLWRMILSRFDPLGYRLSVLALIPLVMVCGMLLSQVPDQIPLEKKRPDTHPAA